MLSLGVLGTAKNTGKTTTLNALLKCLSEKLLALTSIGFDGEDLDHITCLPKPNVFV
jgi:molybdopterin-guanine dinucleotide biosynthesis protein